jgi:hypothetical protein
MALSSLFLNSLPMDNSLAITHFGLLYQAAIAGLEVGIEPTVRLDDDNEPQPDAVLFRVDGNAKIDDDGYISGAPELIAEIAASTVSYDLYKALPIVKTKKYKS